MRKFYAVIIEYRMLYCYTEINYYSTYNFVGDRIDGYEEPLAFLTKEAAEALKKVSNEMVSKGYRLKIFDAYRPQKAVTHFMNWALDTDDVRHDGIIYICC